MTNDRKKLDPDDIHGPQVQIFIKDKDILNIMLIDQDRRPGEFRARSDSMMILTVNNSNRDKTVKVTSLMRDMYVQIPRYSDNRINASYAFWRNGTTRSYDLVKCRCPDGLQLVLWLNLTQ